MENTIANERPRRTGVLAAAAVCVVAAGAFIVVSTQEASASGVVSEAPRYDVTHEDFDLDLLAPNPSARQAAVELPENVDLQLTGFDGIEPSSVRYLGAEGPGEFWVGIDRAGYICLITHIGGEDWSTGFACQDAEAFNRAGISVRQTTLDQSVEVYLTPDSGKASGETVATVSGEILTENLFAVDPEIDSADRSELTNAVEQAGVKAVVIPTNDDEDTLLMESSSGKKG